MASVRIIFYSGFASPERVLRLNFAWQRIRRFISAFILARPSLPPTGCSMPTRDLSETARDSSEFTRDLLAIYSRFIGVYRSLSESVRAASLFLIR